MDRRKRKITIPQALRHAEIEVGRKVFKDTWNLNWINGHEVLTLFYYYESSEIGNVYRWMILEDGKPRSGGIIG